MKSIKVSELTGAALDWAVAICEGEDYCAHDGVDGIGNPFEATRYSTDWSQGGPIIERGRISVIRLEDDEKTDINGFWIPGRVPVYAAVIGEYFSEDQLRNGYGEAICDTYYIDCELVTKGPTTLIAAMRCYVASKMGDTIEVPEELL
jgi:hypothetical protein